MKRPHFLLAIPLLALGTQAQADFYSHRYAGVSFGENDIGGFCRGSERFLDANNAVPGQSFIGQGCSEGGDGWKIYGGWRWTPHLAVEASYHKLTASTLDFEARFEDGQNFVNREELETQMGNAFVVGHWPLFQGFSLFGKLGGGFWMSSLEIHQTGEAFRGVAQVGGSDIRLLPRGDDQNISPLQPSEPGRVIFALKPYSAEGELNDNGAHWGYGLGLSYRHQNNWTIRAEWESFSNIGSNDLRSEFDLETLSLGWSMHF